MLNRLSTGLLISGLIPHGNGNHFNHKQCSIAHNLSLSFSHCPDMTNICHMSCGITSQFIHLVNDAVAFDLVRIDLSVECISLHLGFVGIHLCLV